MCIANVMAVHPLAVNIYENTSLLLWQLGSTDFLCPEGQEETVERLFGEKHQFKSKIKG